MESHCQCILYKNFKANYKLLFYWELRLVTNVSSQNTSHRLIFCGFKIKRKKGLLKFFVVVDIQRTFRSHALKFGIINIIYLWILTIDKDGANIYEKNFGFWLLREFHAIIQWDSRKLIYDLGSQQQLKFRNFNEWRRIENLEI